VSANRNDRRVWQAEVAASRGEGDNPPRAVGKRGGAEKADGTKRRVTKVGNIEDPMKAGSNVTRVIGGKTYADRADTIGESLDAIYPHMTIGVRSVVGELREIAPHVRGGTRVDQKGPR
jgi:hypothetical protein